ncbi:MAG: hypothetical protein FJX72_00165 [Armatimonadetes bacterium]|nr:hypothetical protein [Armatimonadota bacterium]
MTWREKDRLIRRYLLPAFPDYGVSRGIMYAQPLEWVLRGLCLGSSRTPNAVCAYVFVMPLYVPSTVVSLQNADEIGYEYITPENEAEAMSRILEAMRRNMAIITRYDSPAAIARRLLWPLPRYLLATEYEKQAVHYAQILTGQYLKARLGLRIVRAAIALRVRLNGGPDWLEEAARVEQLIGALRSDPRRALALLEEWTAFTKKSLHLP